LGLDAASGAGLLTAEKKSFGDWWLEKKKETKQWRLGLQVGLLPLWCWW